MLNRKALAVAALLVAVLVVLCPLAASAAWGEGVFGEEPNPEAGTVVRGGEDDVQFVYLDAERISTGDEQSVVVGFSADVEDAVVRLLNLGDDTTLDLPSASTTGDAALFQTSFDGTGAYRVSAVYYRLAGDAEGTWRLRELDAESGGAFSVTAADSPSLLSVGDGGDAVTFTAFSDDGGLVESRSLGEVVTLASAAARSSAVDSTVIVLDPGHGGSDGGASGNGLLEKRLTLAIAQYCRDALEEMGGYEVVMTRTGDSYVGLLERAEIARDAGADLFVSIHINALGTGTAQGAEVYIPNDSSWYYEFHELGDELGDRILSRLEALGLYNRGNKFNDYPNSSNVNEDGTPVDEYADGSPADEFSVIRNCRRFGIPAVLVENGFIDNAHDSSLLAQDSFLRSLGESIAESIAETVEPTPVEEPVYGLSDVYLSTSHSSEIGWLLASGVTTGIRADDGSLEFKGEDVVTRGQMAAFLYRLAGSPSYSPGSSDRSRFSDVGSSTPFAKEIWWLASVGVTTGYQDGRFGVNDCVTRADMAAFLRRYVERFIDPSVSSWKSSAQDRSAFSDVTSSTGQAENIWWLAATGISTGYEDGRFGPTDYVIRQDMAAFLYRVSNLPAFEASDSVRESLSDVDEDTVHAEDIWWLLASGVTTGMRADDGSLEFRGGEAVTRGQMAAFLYRLAGSPSYSPSSSDRSRFSDVGSSTPFAKEIWWLASVGVTTGYQDGRFGVDDSVTRADMAAFLRRYYNNVAEGNLYANWKASDAVTQRFSDVTSSTSQAESIWWLAATGISTGYVDGTYGPADNVTRGDMAAFLRRLSVRSGRMVGAAPVSEGGSVGSGGGDLEGDGSMGGDLTGTGSALPAEASDYSIMGSSTATAEQLVRLYKSTGKAYPSAAYASKGASTIEEFVQIVMEEAATEGVRADIVFCQSMKETGWLQFGGQVKVEQCNFAGLGATNDGAAGASFESVRMGIRAQVQHLKAYASKADLVNECVDPRFNRVTRGVAPMLTGLNGRWAVPGDGYGEGIFKLIQSACAL